MVPSEVWDLHYIEQGGLREVHHPWLGDYLGVLPLHSGQVFKWRKHTIILTISKVEVTEIQCYDLALL
jgi:hypothetical protein